MTDSLADVPVFSAPAPDTYPRIWSLCSVEPLVSEERVAGFCIRSIAYLIDRVILSVLRLLFVIAGYAAITTESSLQSAIAGFDKLAPVIVPLFLTMIAVEIAYYTYFHGYTGQTIGKRLCGLTVVDIHGHPIGCRRAFLRWAGYLLSFLVLGLGFFWVTLDGKRQSWHDKIAKSYVVNI